MKYDKKKTSEETKEPTVRLSHRLVYKTMRKRRKTLLFLYLVL